MANVGMTIQLLETFRDRNMWIEGFMTHEDNRETRIHICESAIETIKEQQETIERLEHDLAITQNNLNFYLNGNE